MVRMQTSSTDTSVPKNSFSHASSSSKDGKRKPRRRRNKKVVTDEIAKQPTAAASSAPNNDKKRNQVKKSSDLSKLNLPQLKLVLRGVGDVDKHGTNEKMITLIRDLIDAVNKSIALNITEESSSSTSLLLDEGSAIKILSTKIDSDKVAGEGNVREMLEATHAADRGDNDYKEPGAHVTNELVINPVNDMKSFRTDLLGIQHHNSAVVVRLLYIIPTRKSRRRGEIPGRIYMLLLPPTPTHILQKMSISRSGSSADEPSEIFESTPADRAIAFSQSRIILNSTLSILDKILSTDSINEQRFKKARIEQCLNSKTWKAENVFGAKASRGLARFDSTLESSEDYKLFLEKRAKSEEDRLSRPKPNVSGGITVNDAAHAQTTNSENGMPMSALLLHLKAKREQESKKRRGETSKPRSSNTRPPASSTKTEKNPKNEKERKSKREKSEKRS